VAPRSPTELRLAAIFQQLLGLTTISINDNFFDLGGHSLMAVKLMAAIEREFGRRLPLMRLFDSPTVERLAAILDTPAATNTEWDSLVPIRYSAGKPTLFLIHGAGGNVLLYRELAQAMGMDFSVYGFQSQGLDRRARPYRRVEDMAAHYVRELRAFQPEGPYHLGGYCMGGTIAYEMARVLRQDGAKVGLVALLDTYNMSTVKLISRRGRFSALRQKVGFHASNLAQLGGRDLAGYLAEKLRMAFEAGRSRITTSLNRLRPAASGTPEETGAEVFIQKINHVAGWEFVPRPFSGHITVFRPQKNYDFFPDPRMGWSELVRDELEIVEMPVNPHAMLIEPCATKLAAELRRRIQQKESAHPGSGTERR
jgi:thioesterase domain-containing protein/acyl carrier protein